MILFLYIVFITSSIQATSNDLQINDKAQIVTPLQISRNYKLRLIKRQKKQKTQQVQCVTSGKNQIYFYEFSFYINYYDKLNAWFKNSQNYLKKKPQNYCPKTCKQINQYKIYSKSLPQSTYKNSCKKDQAKESYSFTKQFPIKKDLSEVHDSMLKWILATFVYPFAFIKNVEPTQEFKNGNLAKACPSCSFYLQYNYQYKPDQLDLNITAYCGDKKKITTKTKATLSLMHYWKCQNP